MGVDAGALESKPAINKMPAQTTTKASKISLWVTMAVLSITLILVIVNTVLVNNLSNNVSNCACTQVVTPGNVCPFLGSSGDNDKKFGVQVALNYTIIAMLVIAGILIVTRNFLLG